ncbi:NUDIX hydrolase [Xanthobacter agilis]|uniref:ADP-ribose pyrophosphatase YjhB (NUDIX family) n=1 Tax=Xanthobacter agilis TaxID=47492 RepID=A0ABU0LIM7_XANAG|nr:NUDIX hydrolase [Xanthobacter agilis]MDQ0506989.1 ADP-ribose pyrophosphatase YjhB (NUDIX family) [Xanthobacter agilis]
MSAPSATAPDVIRPILAASAAVFRGPLVLLARRGTAPGTPGAGLWSLPGGRVEPGETLADAARREVREEVGVDADLVAVAAARDIIRRDVEGRLTAHFVVIAYAARWRSGEPRTSDEAPEVGWFHPADVARLAGTQGLAEVVAAAAKILGRTDLSGSSVAI